MIIDTKPGDGRTLEKGLGMLVKAADAAMKSCQKIGLVIPPNVVEVSSRAEYLLDKVKGWTADTLELPREISIEGNEMLDAGKVAVHLVLEKLGKIAKEQIDLGIAADDTRIQQERARDLWQRLNGQTSLPLEDKSTVTVSEVVEELTLTGTELVRAAKRKHALRNA